MADTSGAFWVNPFQMLRFTGTTEPQKGQGEYSDVGIVDDKSESGDICGPLSPRPATPTKSKPMSAPTRNSRRHSFHRSDNLAKSPSGVGGYFLPEKHAADTKAAVLPFNATPYPTKDIQSYSTPPKTLSPHPSKNPEEKQKRRTKRSASFTGQRKHQNSNLHIAELLATSVSLVRANNEQLGHLADDYTGSDDDRDIEWSDEECAPWQPQAGEKDNQLIEEINTLSLALQNMDVKYTEQLQGKNRLIEELDVSLRKCEKESKKKKLEIDRLEGELEASRQAIRELAERQEREMSKVAPPHQETADLKTVEAVRLLESELREKTKAIEELNKRLTISNRRITEAKEKEKKLEAAQQQLQRFQSLEGEWQEKQRTLDGLSSQLELLRKREIELHEKDALIETLNIRLDTSQQVIAELREKSAPHDLLRQLRQKDYILDTLTQQVENIDADLKEKDDEIDALTQKLAEESRQLVRLREQNKQLEPFRARTEEAETRLGQLRKQLVEKEKLLAETQTKYDESSRTLSESQEKLRSQDLVATNLRQEVLDLRQSLDMQTSESRDKERSLANLRDETVHMRSKYQGLLNALSEKDLKIQELDQHIETLQNGLKSASQERDTRMTKTEVRLNALQKVLNSKIETCRDYEKKIAELEEEFDGLRKQLENSKTTGTEKELKINRLVKANHELKEEVSQLKEKMEAKEKEIVILKSRIPKPAPGMAPGASERSSSRTRSRPSSVYGSGGESSSDEAGRSGRIRRHASLSGIDSNPLRRTVSASSLNRRLSDSPRLALSRTKSVIPASGERAPLRQSTLSTVSSPSRHNNAKMNKPRIASTTSTSTVELLKRKTTTGRAESSPINRSAVTQRARDVKVLTNMLSGVAHERKPRLSTIAEGRAATATLATSRRASHAQTATMSATNVPRHQSRIQTSSLNDLSTAGRTPTNAKTMTRTTVGTTSTKPRASLTRPLPTRKASFSN